VPRPPGYHFVQAADGALVVEENHPTEGYTTITWAPTSESPTERFGGSVPAALFAEVIDSFIGERDLRRAEARVARKREATAPAG
jgi:hypothetical protein